MEQGKANRISKLRLILAAGFICVFLFSAWKVASQLFEERKAAQAFDALAAQVGQDAGSAAAAENEGAGSTENFDKYDALYEQNPDLFGWICIEGTKIDYPVMYTPEDPEYYLHRAFDKTYSSSGVPFMDAQCNEDSGNYILYGHDMKNGSMFAGLLDYAKEDFWREHPTIRFDLVDEPGEYEVLAALYTDVSEMVNAFSYQDYAVIGDKESFDKYVGNVRRNELYSTGVSAEYGDQLITLITCSYQTKDGRFMVVARKKHETEP